MAVSAFTTTGTSRLAIRRAGRWVIETGPAWPRPAPVPPPRSLGGRGYGESGGRGGGGGGVEETALGRATELPTKSEARNADDRTSSSESLCALYSITGHAWLVVRLWTYDFVTLNRLSAVDVGGRTGTRSARFLRLLFNQRRHERAAHFLRSLLPPFHTHTHTRAHTHSTPTTAAHSLAHRFFKYRRIRIVRVG
jgi:hypothetical protein